jgi:alpha-D-xyloside xylohydrolase
MMKALPMDFRSDPKVLDIDDQYMFGPALLVSPVVQPKAVTRSVYLPASAEWTNFWTGEPARGGQRTDVASPQDVIPLFVRAGSIIPLGPDLQYAGEKPADPIELRVYPGADGSFTLYEDEGDSYRYEKGAYATIPIQWKEASKTLTIGARAGEFPGMTKQRTFRIVWVRPGKGNGPLAEKAADAEVRYEGKAIDVLRQNSR